MGWSKATKIYSDPYLNCNVLSLACATICTKILYVLFHFFFSAKYFSLNWRSERYSDGKSFLALRDSVREKEEEAEKANANFSHSMCYLRSCCLQRNLVVFNRIKKKQNQRQGGVEKIDRFKRASLHYILVFICAI